MFTAQMSVTDDLITSEGIETSQGVRLKRPPLKSMQDRADTIPHRHDGYEWEDAMSSGVGMVSGLVRRISYWPESYGVG